MTESPFGVVPVAAADAKHIAELLRNVDDDGEAEFYADYLDEHAEDYAIPARLNGVSIECHIEDLAVIEDRLDSIEDEDRHIPIDELIQRLDE